MNAFTMAANDPSAMGLSVLWPFGIVLGIIILWGLLSEVIPGTQYWEARRRYDYCQQFGQRGRWHRNGHSQDGYTAMMRKKNPRWISKFSSNNRWYMFDESVENRRELAKQYGD